MSGQLSGRGRKPRSDCKVHYAPVPRQEPAVNAVKAIPTRSICKKNARPHLGAVWGATAPTFSRGLPRLV